MIKISVIIPVYNVELYLSDCLNSVCGQTLQDIEIICIDDGSTDNSSKILKNYAQKDSRICVIRQENRGPSAARNTGIKQAKGEYVSFIDSDDWVSKNFCETLYHMAKKNNADICGCGFKTIKKGKERIRLAFKKTIVAHTLNAKFRLFNMPAYNYACNKIYRRQMLLDKGLWFIEERYYEDIVWSTLVMQAADKAVCAPKAWYYYRVNPNSIVNTTKDNSKKIEDMNWARQFQKDFINQHHLVVKEMYHKTRIRLLGLPIGKILENETSKKYYFLGFKIAEFKNINK